MTALSIILALALVAALAWAVVLSRRLRATVIDAPPPPERFSPLFRATTSALDAGLVVLNQDCEVLYLNQQAEIMLGTESAVALGQGLITLVRDYQADTLVKEVLRDGEPREMILQPLFGGRTLRLRALLLDAPDMRGAVLLIRDVTQ